MTMQPFFFFCSLLFMVYGLPQGARKCSKTNHEDGKGRNELPSQIYGNEYDDGCKDNKDNCTDNKFLHFSPFSALSFLWLYDNWS